MQNFISAIQYYSIKQIAKIQNQQLHVIMMGNVIGITKQFNYLSFNISDTTASAQATLFVLRSNYQKRQIPNFGDLIQILGTCSTKPLQGQKEKLFLKIKIDRFRIIKTFSKQLQIWDNIMQNKKRRYQLLKSKQIPAGIKKLTNKAKIFHQKQLIEIRSLILSYLFIVLTNNPDINSYLFDSTAIMNHRISKEYVKDKQISQISLQDAIKRSLIYLKQNQVIQTKLIDAQISQNPNSSIQQQKTKYIIKKKYCQRLIVQIQKILYSKQQKGTTLEQITTQLNQKLGNVQKQNYLFDQKFTQKMLQELIGQKRVYKASDKRLYAIR